MEKIKISVLISVFNGAPTLDRTLASIFNQTQSIHDVVLIDDGSSDNSLEIANNWQSKLPIRIIKNSKNIGLVKSLIKGMDFVEGEWIFRIDADDFWEPFHVENISKIINDSHVLLCSRTKLMHEGNFLGFSKNINPPDIRAMLMWDNPIVQSSTCFKKSTYFEVGGYRLKKWEDYDLWIRMLAKGELGFSPIEDVIYNIHENSLSRISKNRAILERMYCQFFAIRMSFKRHPIKASTLFFVLLVRLSLVSLKKFFSLCKPF